VTVAGTPEVLTIKEQFDAILGKLPAPHIPEEGHPAAQKKAARNDRGRERKRR